MSELLELLKYVQTLGGGQFVTGCILTGGLLGKFVILPLTKERNEIREKHDAWILKDREFWKSAAEELRKQP